MYVFEMGMIVGLVVWKLWNSVVLFVKVFILSVLKGEMKFVGVVVFDLLLLIIVLLMVIVL